MLFHALFILSAGCLRSVYGIHNTTIDDNDPLISYRPAGSWGRAAATSLNYGGSHMLTLDGSGTAVYSFVGKNILESNRIFLQLKFSRRRCLFHVAEVALPRYHSCYARLNAHRTA